MSTDWTEDTLPTLGRMFLRNVIDHMRGSSHEAFAQADMFDAEKLSAPFDLAAIQRAYDRPGMTK